MRMKRMVAATLLASAMVMGPATVALADPHFGPGNSQKGPHDPGAKCHPPGQTVDEPGCK
jgi:hypothetical protein